MVWMAALWGLKLLSELQGSIRSCFLKCLLAPSPLRSVSVLLVLIAHKQIPRWEEVEGKSWAWKLGSAICLLTLLLSWSRTHATASYCVIASSLTAPLNVEQFWLPEGWTAQLWTACGESTWRSRHRVTDPVKERSCEIPYESWRRGLALLGLGNCQWK